MEEPGRGKARRAVRGKQFANADLIGFRRGCRESERDLAKSEVEKAVSAAGLAIIVALRSRPAQYLDLAVVEAEALVDTGYLRFERALVGQEYPGRAALDDSGRDRRSLDIGETLRRENHARIFLAKRLQPFAQLRGEGRAVEDEPALVDDD